WLEFMEAVKFFIDAAPRVQTGDDTLYSIMPIREFLVTEYQLVAQCFRAIRPTPLQYACRPGRPRDRPTGHQVRARVVINILVIFVGADNMAYVPPAVVFCHGPRRPESRSLQEDFRS